MRLTRNIVVAGVASLALAGAAIAAKEAKMHVISLQLPDGSIEQVHYSGDVAPQVVLVPAAAPDDVFDAAFGPDSPFAMMDRISAQMNQQAEAMLRQVSAMAPPAAADMPAGAYHYTMVSTSSGSGTCMHSVQITSMGEGKQPKVINSSSGDCGAPTGSAPAALPNAASAPAANVVTPVAYHPERKPEAKAEHAPVI